MDSTKSKLASSRLSAFFDPDDDEPRHTTVDEAKLSQYTSGTVRKTRREKEQEAADAKKRKEEEEAARVYSEFAAAFEGEGVGRKSASTFVKANTQTTYQPVAKNAFQEAQSLAFRDSPSPPPKPKGKRAMDAFLEEIKRDQAEREARYSRQAGHGRSVTALAAYDGQSGSKDRGDPLTSNVFVSNLPTHVTEQSLGNFFAKAGPVGSVKIMWPRAEAVVGADASRRPKLSGLSGFVSFMTRRDAEEALREFDGYEWGGFLLRVGWSKAVPIAARPMYISTTPKRRSRSRSGTRSRSHSRSRSRSRSYSYSPSRGYDARSRSPSEDGDEGDHVTDTFVRAVASEVKAHESDFEKNLIERESKNSRYAFLRKKNRRYPFYKDVLGDKRTTGPEFDDDGYNSIYSSDSAEESERERVRKDTLGRLARKRFEAMLRGMRGTRGEIARCMVFCLEHAEAANEIADIIIASLLVTGTAVPRKMARLHLICDILHNSAASVPSAWKFRQEFQARLGIVFDHMAAIYQSFPNRMSAELFKKQAAAVLDLWDDWIVFSLDFTSELRQRLDGIGATAAEPQLSTEVSQTESFSSKFKASTFQLARNTADKPAEDADMDGEPFTEDVDGEPLNDDVDGEPLNDDMDGEPLYEEDMDGEPMDEDINDEEDVDGEPI